MNKIRVTVWSEGLPENEIHAIKCYPEDINTAIGNFLAKDSSFEITCRSINMEENGLSQEILDSTDVLVWWGHLYHKQVTDETAERVVDAVLRRGMGLLLLHSGFWSKPAALLLGRGASGGKYRECGERERVWIVDRAHPIAEGLEEDWFIIEQAEMYGEPFGMPTPDELVFISWFQGGEVLRSGAVWHKGAGRVFYFAPGHEEFPIYTDNTSVQRVIANACRWLKPSQGPIPVVRHEIDSLEPLPDVPFPERLERSRGRAIAKPEAGKYTLQDN